MLATPTSRGSHVKRNPNHRLGSVGEDTAFHANCKEADIPITINRIYRSSDTESFARYGRTDIQYERLLQVLKQGYFNIPQEIETAELARQYGISD
ncbi:helix-turn-helix domain-containing protein [Halalkalicoccus ordinarius]|uniref:helix-turn-helix domain-containing protein n=1 Tax=Halalkalicoccus ordinarius TaxID=3116651 RepID=UPI00300E9E11